MLRSLRNMTNLMFTVNKYREHEEVIASRTSKDPSKVPKETKNQVNNIKKGGAGGNDNRDKGNRDDRSAPHITTGTTEVEVAEETIGETGKGPN